MKTRTFVSILILVLAVLIVAGSCATNKMAYISKDFELYGTWVNPDYNDKNPAAKMTFFPNGRAKFYFITTITDYEEVEFVVTNKWVDSKGNIWYTSRNKIGAMTHWNYALVRISDFGKTMELAMTSRNYPTDINPDTRTYQYRILYRQE